MTSEELAVRPGPRPAARIDARTLFVWSLAALTVVVVTDNPIYRAIVAVAALDVLQARLPAGRNLRPLAIAIAAAAIVAVAVTTLTSHTGATVLARLPDGLPLVGGPVTLEALAYGGSIGLGLAAAFVAVAPLSLVLEAHEIVDALPASLERTGIALAASMNLVSGTARTFTAVRDAQRMRGWRPRGVRSWRNVLVPVVLTAIEDSVLVAEAMEARAFGSGARTAYGDRIVSRFDVAVVVVALGAAAVFVGLRVAGLVGEWYPYPVLSAPVANPVAVVACVCLALPAFGRSDRA